MSFLMTTEKSVLLQIKNIRQNGDQKRPVFPYHKAIKDKTADAARRMAYEEGTYRNRFYSGQKRVNERA